jgi:hypothetical protein
VPPSYRRGGLSREEQSQIKNSVRTALGAARDEQLEDPSTHRFVRSMEEPGPAHKHEHSIRKLLVNGADLAARLGEINKLPADEQVAKLREVVRPYLVLVHAEERDPHTGIKYGDIWRYFRLTWAIPNIPAPGRKIYYLVRDAAQPNHPVMAIAALSNTALQVKDRDDYIGWTAESVTHRLRKALIDNDSQHIESIITLMERHIEQGLADIDSSGMVAPDEIAMPTEAVLRGLHSLTEGYARERQLQLIFLNGTPETINEDDAPISEYENLDSIGAERPTEVGEPQVSDAILGIDKKANRNTLKVRRQMILKKRSLALYQLLYARRILLQLRAATSLSDAVKTALPRDEFRAALTYALFSNKRERVGINMLEITTCGAIPPYNHLLGGKLMALLLLSPQVVSDYRARYANQASWITSQVKGEEVMRPCDLVFLSTTSLYTVGSSQYNRVALPAGTFHPQQPRIAYKSRPTPDDLHTGSLRRSDGRDWQTSGFGTVHFSADTSAAIEKLGIQDSGYREVNSIFGEGPSPKLRKIRSGLLAVGLDPDVLLRHNQPRLLYCVDLFAESRRYLNGESVTLPEYITHPECFPDATEQIAEFWRQRWLLNRLRSDDVLEHVANFNPASFTPYDSVVTHRTKENLRMTNSANQTGADHSIPPPSDSSTSAFNVRFLQLLYLRRRSYADFLDSSIIESFHIPTPLDDFILKHVEDGYSVILTGNAGDGKTHLLKWLKHRLGNVRMIEDASVYTSEEVVAAWRQAISEGQPFCLAANEWPLLELIEGFADQLPQLRELERQLEKSLIYGDLAPAQDDAPRDKIIVVNLDLRNPLAPKFVDDVMNTLFQPEIFATCAHCPGAVGCDAARNRALLMDSQRVRAALKALLARLSIFGRHVTVRELLGFLSYSVFGGRACDALTREHGKDAGWYSEQMFNAEARGAVFDLLRAHLDPANISHPKWDMHLSFSGTHDTDWELRRAPLPPALAKDPRAYQYLKRRFLFEHPQGLDVLKMLPDDERAFAKLLDEKNQDLDLARDDLVRAINAFFCYPLSTADQNLANELIVWSSHSYDERVARAFTSWFTVDRRNIQVLRPRLTPRIAAAFEYLPDHLLLTVFTPKGTVELPIDFALYHTLMDVRRGLPAVLVDEGRSVRLHRFMSHLEASRPDSEAVSRIKSYTVQGQDVLTVEVDTVRKKIRTFNYTKYN